MTHIVFGAAGALGSAIVRALVTDNKTVRAIVRNAKNIKQNFPDSVEICELDALNQRDVIEACREASIIYHCINVPYHRWAEVMPVVTENILAGAMLTNACVVFPGNVYGYGPLQTIPAVETHPLAAKSRKGELRNQLESRLMNAHREGAVQVVIPRFPDYYGPNVTNKLFGPIFHAALSGKKALWPGRLDMPHSLVYIDDAAQACIQLGEEERAYGKTWHVSGPNPVTGEQFMKMVYRASGERANYGKIGKGLLRLVGIGSPEARELIELMYEFEEPLVLDGERFRGLFPSFTFTSHEEAIQKTLQWFQNRSVGSFR
ncbi:NAD-dependent epimerase/dehydratase family protein [Ectobacillus panaciterrae]|uniref:NAD-dependent epimerase/dehydratase family protein n=1 Tax=Ectobacillus panaciterrae TaxID=363872 RepID=UPI0003F93011|nr:NAD-dependent epimerase/dehydratase family protein [Ectobacillus panaciterrae]